jgi:hypothetical protein
LAADYLKRYIRWSVTILGEARNGVLKVFLPRCFAGNPPARDVKKKAAGTGPGRFGKFS